MQRIVSVFLLLGALIPMVSHAQAANQLTCRREPGFSVMPIVPDAETAKDIYRVIVRHLAGERAFIENPIVTAHDAGDRWEMSQTNNLPKLTPGPVEGTKNETVLLQAGGGEFWMEIDKCSGAISHFVGNR